MSSFPHLQQNTSSSASIIRKLGVNHSASSARKVYLGEGYKTQNRTVWLRVVHTTFHCVAVVCVLTTQVLHRWGYRRNWKGLSGIWSSSLGLFSAGRLVLQPCWAFIFPLEMTQNALILSLKMRWTDLLPFKSLWYDFWTHGGDWERPWMSCGKPSYRMDGTVGRSPVSCMELMWFHRGRRSRRVPQDHSDIFCLLPYQNLGHLSSVAIVPCWWAKVSVTR